MIQIDYAVNKQLMTRAGATDPIAAYASEYNYAHFTFNDDWDGLNLTVIFNHKLNGRYLVLPDANNVALIPTEVIAVPGFEVSVFGTDGDAKRITSTIDFVSVLPSGVDAPVYPLPPSPDVYAQIYGIAQSVRDDADAGKFDGEKGDKGDPGPGAEPATNDEIGTVKPDVATLEMKDAEGTIGVKNGGIGTDQIADEAVTVEKLAPDSVTSDKLTNSAVGTEKIENKAVTKEKMADDFFDTDGGAASFDFAYEIIEDVAVLRYNVDLASVQADEEMKYVHVWTFPDDSNLVSGKWDASGSKYYSEVASNG